MSTNIRKRLEKLEKAVLPEPGEPSFLQVVFVDVKDHRKTLGPRIELDSPGCGVSGKFSRRARVMDSSQRCDTSDSAMDSCQGETI